MRRAFSRTRCTSLEDSSETAWAMAMCISSTSGRWNGLKYRWARRKGNKANGAHRHICSTACKGDSHHALGHSKCLTVETEKNRSDTCDDVYESIMIVGSTVKCFIRIFIKDGCAFACNSHTRTRAYTKQLKTHRHALQLCGYFLISLLSSFLQPFVCPP